MFVPFDHKHSPTCLQFTKLWLALRVEITFHCQHWRGGGCVSFTREWILGLGLDKSKGGSLRWRWGRGWWCCWWSWPARWRCCSPPSWATSPLPHSHRLENLKKVFFLCWTLTFSEDSLDLSVSIENVNKDGGHRADRWLARVLSAGWRCWRWSGWCWGGSPTCPPTECHRRWGRRDVCQQGLSQGKEPPRFRPRQTWGSEDDQDDQDD